MNDNHIENELQVMAQAVLNMEQGLKRLDLLELEILAVKAGYREQINTFKNAICGMLGGISADKQFKDLIGSNALTPTPKLNGSIADNKN